MEIERAKSASEDKIYNYFKELSDVLVKYDLTDRPHLIFTVNGEVYPQIIHRLLWLDQQDYKSNQWRLGYQKHLPL